MADITVKNQAPTINTTAAKEEEEKLEPLWKFYFQAKWYTAFTIVYLIATLYLVLFYLGNIGAVVKFAFFSLFGSAQVLGLEFVFWGLVFVVSAVVPFILSFYAIFLLPKIWRAKFGRVRKLFLSLVLFVVIPLIIIITDTGARIAYATEALLNFMQFHNISY